MDIWNTKYGMLTVVGPALATGDKNDLRICQCGCGNLCLVPRRELMSGNVLSCGCLMMNDRNIVDLRGTVKKMLTVLAPTQERTKQGSVIWLCLCSCGNLVKYSQSQFIWSETISCGCYRKGNADIQSHLHHFDGACIECLTRKKRADNKTGYTGVSIRKNGKYRAMIGFKGKKINLGTYDTLDEAVTARQKAEERIHKPFLDQYYSAQSGM